MAVSKNHTKIFVYCNVRLFCDAISLALGSFEDFRVVGTASNTAETLSMCTQNEPDVLLFDATMDEALPMVQRIAELALDIRLVALATGKCHIKISKFVSAGVHQFVAPEDSLSDLRRCVEAVAQNGLWCSAALAKVFLNGLMQSEEKTSNGDIGRLTTRQYKILELVESGKRNKEIAKLLNIEAATVKNHMHQILKRLDASNRSEAASMFRRLARLEAGTANMNQ